MGNCYSGLNEESDADLRRNAEKKNPEKAIRRNGDRSDLEEEEKKRQSLMT
jgi:hypothetical protein